VVSEDAELVESVLRLCAAAGVDAVTGWGVPPGPVPWETAPLVLVGDEVAERMIGITRRPGVLLVGRDLDEPGIWRRAVALGAEHVVLLPDGEEWLLDRIADAAEGVGARALTLAVLGGRGGAGASTLACALAVTAAREGRRALLVDADPLGGGVDVLLGAERAAGVRWPELAASRGRVNAVELERALPLASGVRALSWDRGGLLGVPAEAVRTVLGAARRRGGLVVVDLPRRIDEAAGEALAQCDAALLVVPAELRAMAAAGRVAASARMRVADLRAVVRARPGAAAVAEEIAEGLHLPLAGELPAEPGLDEDLERGRPPGARPRGPLARFCSAFLTEAHAALALPEGWAA